jgi:rubrerythrin
MYPEFARVAREERVLDTISEFEEQAQESAGHARLFKDALEKAEKRFAGLAKVEARHARRYADALDARKGAKGHAAE